MEDKPHRRTRSRRPWGKILLTTVAALLLVLIVSYLVLTSSAFFKSFLLPKVGEALNAKVTVSEASLSPFSRVELRKLRVDTTGTEPLLTADLVRVRYSLWQILKGNIHIDEVTLNAPVLQIVQEADGSSNLDPILESKKDEGEDDPSKPDEPTRLQLRNFAVNKGVLRQIKKEKDGSRSETELRDLDLTLDQLGNKQSGKVQISAALTSRQIGPGTGPENTSLLQAQISGGYDISLTSELLPESLKGSTTLSVVNATGGFQDAAGLRTVLEADVTPEQVKQLAFRFAKGEQSLGELRVSGPLRAETKEGNLKIELTSLDQDILNLLAGQGTDFGRSTFSSSNQVAISKEGTFFAANGSVQGRQVSVAREEVQTPILDLNLSYQFTLNLAEKSAVLQRLDLSALQAGKDLLRTSLDRQMNLSWGQTVRGYKDASLQLWLTNLNLADWRAVTGTNLAAGNLSAQAAVSSQQDGKLLQLNLSLQGSGLVAQFGTNRVEDAGLDLTAAGTVSEMKRVNLNSYSFNLRQHNAVILQGNGAARYSIDTKDAAAQLNAEGSLARLSEISGVSDLSVRSGVVKLSANFGLDGPNRKSTGSIGLNQFTGTYGEYQFENFQAGLEYNVALESGILNIQRAAVTFSQGFNAGGSFDLTGKYDPTKKTGRVAYKALNLNENTFRPFLAPSLGENKLVSISLDASGEAKMEESGESAIQSELKITNWRVEDKEGKLPKTPLSVTLRVDAAKRDQLLELRNLLVQLSPTDRAQNNLELKGKMDLSKTNSTPSFLSLKSDSFDLTPYYDMFAGPVAENPTAAVNPNPAGGDSAASTEPEPVALPFQQLKADLSINRLYLRELAISNWTGTVSIKSNVVEMKPFSLILNGGQVNLNGTVDLRSPGYRYQLALSAENVPLEPLAKTFSTNSSTQLQGNFFAKSDLQGAGITGPNIRKNLAGTVSFNLTNMNYQVVGPKLKRILVPISMALRVPELLETPINWVSAGVQVKDGTANLNPLMVESEAFFVQGQGSIALADVLTNSTLSIPLDLSLRRSLAEKANLLPANTDPNAKYAPLPRFVSVKGTLGAPETDINKLVLAGLLARGAAGLGIGNDKVEKQINAIGNILSGQSGSTNQPGTNTSPAGNLLQSIGGLLGGNKDSSTESASPPTDAPPKTNAPAKLNPFDLLRGLQKNQP